MSKSTKGGRTESTLLLWGDTQVGKSTLLTTALYADPSRLKAIDRGKSAEALAVLFRQWQLLSTGRWVAPTSNQLDLDLATGSGSSLRLRDIPGGDTRNVHVDWVHKRLKEAQGVLFVVEWGTRDVHRQMDAIRGAWSFCSEVPTALCFTKCERALSEEDEAWERPSDWWKEYPEWDAHAELIERFGARVWPTSSCGYHRESGHPALILSEFGDPRPFEINPHRVADPLEWLLDEMGVQ